MSKEAELEYQQQIDSLQNELKLSSKLTKSLQQELKAHKVKKFANENFNQFFFKFMTDSVFQLSRIKFPLKNVTWIDGPGTDIDTLRVQKSEWKYDSFYFYSANERTQIYDNYDLKFQQSNERALHWYGIESGGDAKYFFKGYNGQWFMVSMEQLGD